MHRSLIVGIVVGVLAATGLAILGAFLVGAGIAVLFGFIGAVVGLFGGGAIAASRRRLTEPEIIYSRDIYRDSVNLPKLKITRDGILATGAPRTVGNTMHLKSSWNDFVGGTMDLSGTGHETLIHEMGHAWQWQNGGWAYIPKSLWAQLKAAVGSGDRGGAYRWNDVHAAGKPWEKWNPEQQASAIEDYNKAFRAGNTSQTATLMPYMNKVWSKQGAPKFF